MTTVTAQLSRIRMSSDKIRTIADTIRGCTVTDALRRLSVAGRRSAQPLATLIASAVANAEHNYGWNGDNLRIARLTVDEGITLKRWMPRAQGRATKILKRTASVTVELAEIEEGKDRTAPRKDAIAAAIAEGSHKKEQQHGSDHVQAHDHDHGPAKPNASGTMGKVQKFFRRKAS